MKIKPPFRVLKAGKRWAVTHPKGITLPTSGGHRLRVVMDSVHDADQFAAGLNAVAVWYAEKCNEATSKTH